MVLTEWRSDYSVGVAVFDDEHKKLIGFINHLHEAMAEGATTAALMEICDGLIAYTLTHFRHEEMYFDDWNYPDAEAHCRSHTRLRQDVFVYRELIAACAAGGPEAEKLAGEMAEFLRQWLSIHIMVDDRAFGEFLADKGVR